jgi:hypothetical protein
LSLKKSFGLIMITLLLGGCPKEQKHPTLDEIFGDTDLLDDALSDSTLSNFTYGPLPPPPPPLPKTGPLIINNLQVLQGALKIPAVHKDFRRRQGSLRNCYAMTLRENPKNQGQVGVKLAFDERGHVTEALILESTMTHPISDCLLAKLKRFRFPQQPNPKGQVKALLKFSPQ